MGFKISTAVQTELLTALRTQFNGNFVLKIYGGAVPANAHDSIGAATLLRTVSNNGAGTGLSFEAALVNGMLVKTSAEVWSGPNVATGEAAFYRAVFLSDDGTASTTQPRLQGTVGLLNADLILGSVALVNGVTDPAIGQYIVGLPVA